MDNGELFKKLISDNTKTAEEIYEAIYNLNNTQTSTSKIFRGLKNWNNCIYFGSIGKNDFAVSESSSSSLADDNVYMEHDDYKEVIIKFINQFRKKYNTQYDGLLKNLIDYIPEFINNVFDGYSTRGNIQNQRRQIRKFDKKRQMYKNEMSMFKEKEKNVACAEINSTIGNILQFIGFETLQISGYLEDAVTEDWENHFFILIKHGNTEKNYDLIDLFNLITIPSVLPADYNFKKGFNINIIKNNKTYSYVLNGPLYEMTDEILEIEKIIRWTNIKINYVSRRSDLGLDSGDVPVRLVQQLEKLLAKIQSSNFDEKIKIRFIEYIQLLQQNKIFNIINDNTIDQNQKM